ncbi:MAG: AAA family ATPase [Candidatus Micrarchaeaceae archaeon]
MVRLEDIAFMNPWWTKGEKFADSDRDLVKFSQSMFKFERAVPMFKSGNIYVIKGPRRTGKTVYLKNIILKLLGSGVMPMQIFYYSMDGLHSAKELRTSIINFLEKPAPAQRYIMLDEAQNVSGWESVIQALVNEGLLKDTVVIVTGSLAHLFRQELMPGRGTEGNVYLMHTITFKEFCIGLLSDVHTEYGVNRINQLIGYNFTNNEAESLLNSLKGATISLEGSLDEIYAAADSASKYAIPLRKLFEVYIRTGGYPIAINSFFSKSAEKQIYSVDHSVYEELYLYAKNDAATVAGSERGDPRKAAAVLKHISDNLGKKVSYSKIAQAAGMNKPTFIEYAGRLQESYVFIVIKGLNSKMEQARMQKSYFSDPLIYFASDAEQKGEDPNSRRETLLESDSLGCIIEGIVAAHLSYTKESEPMKRYETYLNFFSGTKEIDFTYKRDDGSIVGIEVKYQNTVSTKNDLYKTSKIKDYVLLTKDIIERGTDYIAVPVYLLLSLLEKSRKSL